MCKYYKKMYLLLRAWNYRNEILSSVRASIIKKDISTYVPALQKRYLHERACDIEKRTPPSTYKYYKKDISTYVHEITEKRDPIYVYGS
jgi:hypothetical protein